MRHSVPRGILPAETYYAQVPTTTLNARGTVDGHALELLPEMVARYVTPFTESPASSASANAQLSGEGSMPAVQAR